jgi:hypothetical protein
MMTGVDRRERYDVRLERNGTWTVYDIFSGLAVTWQGLRLDRLRVEQAFSIVNEINHLDMLRREDRGC